MTEFGYIICGICFFPVAVLVTLMVISSLVPMRQVRSSVKLAPIHIAGETATDSIFMVSADVGCCGRQYRFYVRNEDGSVTPQLLAAGDTVFIFEDPEIKGEGTWTTETMEKDRSSFSARFALDLDGFTRVKRQEFRVPVGSVVDSFQTTQ